VGLGPMRKKHMEDGLALAAAGFTGPQRF
jgi:hypothetical protein